MNLREKLNEYKNITIKLIDEIEREEYDNLDKLLSKRQDLINDIEKLKYTKEDFLKLCKEFDILVLQQKLIKLTNEKKANLRHNIDNLSASQTANKSYGKRYAVDSVFFNKKI